MPTDKEPVYTQIAVASLGTSALFLVFGLVTGSTTAMIVGLAAIIAAAVAGHSAVRAATGPDRKPEED